MAHTAQDAMYELVCKLHIHPIRIPRYGKLLAVIYLILCRQMPLSKIPDVWNPYPPRNLQKNIIDLTEQVSLTTAELIKYPEKGVVKMPSEELLIDTVYQDESTYENLHNDARFSWLKNHVMKAVVDLYLNQQIIFE